MQHCSTNTLYWSHALSLENVMMSEGLMARYFLTWSVTWKVKTPKTSRRVWLCGTGLVLENSSTQRKDEGMGLPGERRRKKHQRSGGGVYSQVCVWQVFRGKGVCFVKGRSERVACCWLQSGWMWIWHSTISHENTLLVFQPIPHWRSHGPNYTKARPHTLKYIYTHTHRGDTENWMLHKIFPMQLSKWELEIETREESRARKGRKRVKVAVTGWLKGSQWCHS